MFITTIYTQKGYGLTVLSELIDNDSRCVTVKELDKDGTPDRLSLLRLYNSEISTNPESCVLGLKGFRWIDVCSK